MKSIASIIGKNLQSQSEKKISQQSVPWLMFGGGPQVGDSLQRFIAKQS